MFSRQEMVIGKDRQKLLSKSSVTIVGVGAIGSVAANLLCRAGIGNLTLIDRDIVEENNLQRQLFEEADIFKPKAIRTRSHLQKISKTTDIITHVVDLDRENIHLIKSDLVIGATDNLESRFLINDYCLKEKIPWIYTGAISAHGYVMDIMPNGPCFGCVFEEASNIGTCDTVGILNTASTVAAAFCVNEAIKLLTKGSYDTKLIRFDLDNNTIEKISVKKRKGCPACCGEYRFLNRSRKNIIKMCGTGIYQMKDKKINLEELKKRTPNHIDSGTCIHFGEFTVFDDGRVLIKARDIKEAKKLYQRFI